MNINATNHMVDLGGNLRAKIKTITQSLIFLLLTGVSYAARIQVPQDQPTIQVGINVARAGDKVKVAPGIYEENIILKTGIELVGAGADETIITSNKEGMDSLSISGQCRGTGFNLRDQRENGTSVESWTSEGRILRGERTGGILGWPKRYR